MALRLEAIRITNFKSFKDTHTIAGLDGQFTAIVGPNGSGKSNIIDSILFVLGYRARKMRHAMLRDLITSGCTECSVELVFNQFKLARTLRARQEDAQSRGCTSKYILNGDEIASAELSTFLKEQGIDVDNNRFLILQGEIENISMMAPLELLDYIEDCIGTSSYKTSIEEAEREALEKEAEHETASNGLKFIETDYLYKEGKKNEKFDYLVFKNDTLGIKKKIVAMKEEISSRKEQGLAAEHAEVEAELRELQKRNEKCMQEIRKLEAIREGMDIKAREDELLRMRRQAQAAERDNKNKEAKKERLGKEISKLEKEIAESISRAENWEKEAEAYRRQISDNNEEIRRLSRENDIKKKELAGYEEVEGMASAKREAENRLVILMKKRDGMAGQESEVALLKAQIEELENGSATAGVDSENRSNTAKTGDGRIISPEMLRAAEEEAGQVKKDIGLTRQEIEKRRRRAEDFRFVEEASRSEREVVGALSGIEGVHGLLKNLGSVESGYEVAVEAATKLMGSVVVETTAVAEKCIAEINKKKLSRTTFIILDRIGTEDGSGMNSAGKKTRNENLLYKKVKCDKKFVNVFFFALRDTLVVETLGEARSLAFGAVRHRVVTLDGKLLEKSGVMCGGKVAKKMKSVAELESICKNMEQLYEEKCHKAEQYRRAVTEQRLLQKKVAQLGSLRTELANKTQSIDMAGLACIDGEIAGAKESLRRIEAKRLPVGVKVLQGEIQILSEKIDYLERINQEARIKLECRPRCDVRETEERCQALKLEYGCVEPVHYDRELLDKLEADYKVHYSKFKQLQDSIGELRTRMGNEYHEEAGHRTRLEEISELLGECKRIRSNCQEKRRAIEAEHVLVRSLLESAGMGTEHASDAYAFCEMTSAELKAESHELIEALNARETESFQRLKTAGRGADMEDVELYRAIFAEYDSARRSYEEAKATVRFLREKMDALRKSLEDMRTARHARFMEGFGIINRNLKEIFSLITFGGNAELDLVDYLDPFAAGIVLSIMPPKKSWKQISNLSGGEKTLSSLSLIFALHKYRPSSFYVMDEIDAALDYKNVSLIAQYLGRVDSQFIVISLRDSMFENAKTLVGVYKNGLTSNAVVVNVDRMVGD